MARKNIYCLHASVKPMETSPIWHCTTCGWTAGKAEDFKTFQTQAVIGYIEEGERQESKS